MCVCVCVCVCVRVERLSAIFMCVCVCEYTVESVIFQGIKINSEKKILLPSFISRQSFHGSIAGLNMPFNYFKHFI